MTCFQLERPLHEGVHIMAQTTAESTTLSWLPGFLAKAQEVSEEQVTKFMAGIELALDDEKVFEVPAEIRNLLIYNCLLTMEMNKANQKHIATHIVNFGEEDTDHSSEQCDSLQADVSYLGHKVKTLSSLVWVAIWEHLERPSKNFSMKKLGETTLVVVETHSKNDFDLENLSDLVIGTIRGGAFVKVLR